VIEYYDPNNYNIPKMATVVIEEKPLAHPPGFVRFPDPQPNNCRIKRVTFK